MRSDVIERAAKAWAEAAKFAGKNAGAFEGESADEIIMQAIGRPYSRETKELYRAYEKAVVEKVRGPGWERKRYQAHGSRAKGSTKPLSEGERERILWLLEDGLKPKEVAEVVGRSLPLVYQIRRACA